MFNLFSKLLETFAHFQQVSTMPQTQKEAAALDEHMKFKIVKFSFDVVFGTSG